MGPSAVLAGSIVQGRRLAEAKGRDVFEDESDMSSKHQYLGDILHSRATTNPEHVLFTVINSKGQEVQKLTCAQLHKKAERVACLLIEKAHLVSGDHVALIFAPGVDLVALSTAAYTLASFQFLFVHRTSRTFKQPFPQLK